MHKCALFSILFVASFAVADTGWPTKLVSIEQLVRTTKMDFSVPKRAAEDIKGPVTLRVHIDRHGKVQKVAVMESSGSELHDNGAVRTFKLQRFKPFTVAGEAIDVTLVVPLHLPLGSVPKSRTS